MIRRWTKLYTFVWVFASVLVRCAAGNQTEKPEIWKCVRVERAIGGDTCVYADPHAVKVRLIGINASEMRGKEGVQPFAQKATAWLRA
jgi:endonuclease YncB( thermonuclease family)